MPYLQSDMDRFYLYHFNITNKNRESKRFSYEVIVLYNVTGNWLNK